MQKGERGSGKNGSERGTQPGFVQSDLEALFTMRDPPDGAPSSREGFADGVSSLLQQIENFLWS